MPRSTGSCSIRSWVSLPDETAVLCILILRGPQTPGELKQRTERLHRFEGLTEVHQTLERLAARELVERLDRRPGQKEERYRQLLGGDVEPEPPSAAAPQAPALEARVAALEAEVASLRELIEQHTIRG